MQVEMITHPSLVSATVFYIFAGLAIAGAAGAVTLVDQRRSGWMFLLCAASFAVILTLEGATILALGITAVGITTLAVYMRIHHRSSEQREPAMEDGPSRPLALFIALCMLTALTPIWSYSIWKSHQAAPLINSSRRVIELLVSEYLETTVIFISVAVIASLFMRANAHSEPISSHIIENNQDE